LALLPRLAYRAAVDELSARSCYPRNVDGRYRATCLFAGTEWDQHKHVLLRITPQLENNLGNDTQGSFTTADQLGEVVPGRIFQHVGTRPDDLARGENHLQVEHIVARYAVLHRFRPA